MGQQVEGKQYVKDLSVGTVVHSHFLVKDKRLVDFKNKPGKFMMLTLKDRTGEIRAKVWDQAESKWQEIRKGRVAFVTGEVAIYNNSQEVNITNITEAETYCEADYFQVDSAWIEEMVSQLKAIVSDIRPGSISQLADSFLQSEWFKSYCYAPAAQTYHHNYPGGLLEHSLGVMRICRAIAEQRDGIDTDLMVIGAMLHDVGKVREIAYYPGIDYTDEGRLLGHIVLGIELVGDLISRNGIGDSEFRNRVLHMIASHHGEYEWQSPKRPKFIEARLLHLADMMDADIYKFQNVVHAEEGSKWSDYIRVIGNRVYQGSDKSGEG